MGITARGLLRGVLCGGLLAAAVGVSCCAPKEPEVIETDWREVEGLTYAEIAARWNARAALLERVWSRAAVSMAWTEEDGRSRYEQGRGHLQMVQPGRFALSVHKLGEVLFWFGSDDELYWLIDRSEPRSVVFGRHDSLTTERMLALALPATPLDLAAMTGALPLPELSAADEPVLYRSDDVVRSGVRFDLQQGWRTLRYHIDPARMVPVRVELLDSDGSVLVVAEQEAYGGVDVAGYGGVRPLFPSRMRVYHEGSTLTLSMEGMSSRSPAGEISDAAFDLPSLVDRFGPMKVFDIDALVEEE